MPREQLTSWAAACGKTPREEPPPEEPPPEPPRLEPPLAEEPLPGGLTDRTVRAGATVRRPAGPWTPAVQALLVHLADKGFPAPRPHGTDGDGREVVSYIEGAAGLWPWPPVLTTDAGIAAVGRAIRAYHEAVADFVPPAGARWQIGHSVPLPGEIICHGDLGPTNIIWRGDELVGIVDWELAHPGPALEDLAWAAVALVPLVPDEALAGPGFTPDRPRRLAVLATAYGCDDLAGLLCAVLGILDSWNRRIAVLGPRGAEPWATYHAHGLHRRAQRDHAWIEEHFVMLAGG